jgi:hypothetical protein
MLLSRQERRRAVRVSLSSNPVARERRESHNSSILFLFSSFSLPLSSLRSRLRPLAEQPRRRRKPTVLQSSLPALQAQAPPQRNERQRNPTSPRSASPGSARPSPQIRSDRRRSSLAVLGRGVCSRRVEVSKEEKGRERKGKVEDVLCGVGKVDLRDCRGGKEGRGCQYEKGEGRRKRRRTSRLVPASSALERLLLQVGNGGETAAIRRQDASVHARKRWGRTYRKREFGTRPKLRTCAPLGNRRHRGRACSCERDRAVSVEAGGEGRKGRTHSRSISPKRRPPSRERPSTG